jgi:hypothetical protein
LPFPCEVDESESDFDDPEPGAADVCSDESVERLGVGARGTLTGPTGRAGNCDATAAGDSDGDEGSPEGDSCSLEIGEATATTVKPVGGSGFDAEAFGT